MGKDKLSIGSEARHEIAVILARAHLRLEVSENNRDNSAQYPESELAITELHANVGAVNQLEANHE